MVVVDTPPSISRRKPTGLHHAVSDRLGGAACNLTVLLLVALLLLRTCTQLWGPQFLSTCSSSGGSAIPAPAVLGNLLVMVTFYWDINHLAFLTQVLTTVKAYPVETDIIVVTNKPNRMLNYRRGIFDDAPIYQVVGIDNKSDPYGMTWAHRDIATKAMAEGNYTAFMYVEDDVLVRWETMVAWAEDDALLAPFGFQRGFFRVESNFQSGRLMMMDQHMGNIVLSRYNRTLHLKQPDCDPAARICDFVQLPNPYFGMWVASRERLQHFMTTKYWRREDVPTFPDGPWKVREMAAGSLQFADTPEGFFSAAVVPYQQRGRHLQKNCALFHLSNKYCARQTEARAEGIKVNFCTEAVHSFIHP